MSLLQEIEAFLERHNIAATTFGMKTVRDPNLVRELKTGRDVRLSTAERCRAFMSALDAEGEAAE